MPYKEEFVDVIRYQEVQLQRTGVEVHMSTAVTPEMIAAEEPDAVVVATGARPIVPPFPGLEETRWMTAYDLLDGRDEVSTPTAFIVGAGPPAAAAGVPPRGRAHRGGGGSLRDKRADELVQLGTGHYRHRRLLGTRDALAAVIEGFEAGRLL